MGVGFSEPRIINTNTPPHTHTHPKKNKGGFPVVLDNLWLGAEEGAAIASALVPKLQKTQAAVEVLLYEVATLEVALQAGTDAVTLANLMPKHWADFIRNSPMEEVKPIGTTPMRRL